MKVNLKIRYTPADYHFADERCTLPHTIQCIEWSYFHKNTALSVYVRVANASIVNNYIELHNERSSWQMEQQLFWVLVNLLLT